MKSWEKEEKCYIFKICDFLDLRMDELEFWLLKLRPIRIWVLLDSRKHNSLTWISSITTWWTDIKLFDMEGDFWTCYNIFQVLL
jgi:hypothetical protein